MRFLPVIAVLLAASATPAIAQTPPDVADLVGARAAGGEGPADTAATDAPAPQRRR